MEVRCQDKGVIVRVVRDRFLISVAERRVYGLAWRSGHHRGYSLPCDLDTCVSVCQNRKEAKIESTSDAYAPLVCAP